MTTIFGTTTNVAMTTGILTDGNNCPAADSLTVEQLDADGDGVPDDDDTCAETPLDEIANADGCSVNQTCPCDDFRNHGQFVSCTSREVENLVQLELISEEDGEEIVSNAAHSSCGKKSKP